MDHEDDAALLAELSRAMSDSDGTTDTARTMFDQARLLLPCAEHVSVTIRARRGRFSTLHSSTALAEKADGAQYELDQGPCVEAASDTGAGWFRSGSLATDPRWPRWGPQAASLGLNSLLSVQLLDQDRPYGAINLYAEGEREFADLDDVSRALAWSVHVAIALSATRLEADLRTAIDSRHDIGVAQGILMNRHDIDQDTAFRYLTRIASQREQKLNAVAAQIVRAHHRGHPGAGEPATPEPPTPSRPSQP